MCGIAGIYRLGNRPIYKLDQFASALLEEIEDRGRDATGFVAFDDAGAVQLQKASCRAFYFNQHRSRIMDDARMVLLHTRFATQGKAAFPENNHPVEAGGVYCVHNGHIFNDREVFHRSGKTRSGEVDSEAIPALVASQGWENLPKSLEELDGGYAIALASPKHAGELVLAKGPSYPLVYVKTQTMIVWASSSSAIREAWQRTLGTPPTWGKYHQMTEGEALLVNRKGLQTVSFEPPYVPTYKATVYHTTTPVKALEAPKESYATTEEIAWDSYIRCDDCGSWEQLGNLLPAHENLLCNLCYSWAEQAGIVPA